MSSTLRYGTLERLQFFKILSVTVAKLNVITVLLRMLKIIGLSWKILQQDQICVCDWDTSETQTPTCQLQKPHRDVRACLFFLMIIIPPFHIWNNILK